MLWFPEAIEGGIEEIEETRVEVWSHRPIWLLTTTSPENAPPLKDHEPLSFYLR
jgi:hypothetical protein